MNRKITIISISIVFLLIAVNCLSPMQAQESKPVLSSPKSEDSEAEINIDSHEEAIVVMSFLSDLSDNPEVQFAASQAITFSQQQIAGMAFDCNALAAAIEMLLVTIGILEGLCMSGDQNACDMLPYWGAVLIFYKLRYVRNCGGDIVLVNPSLINEEASISTLNTD